MKRFLQAILVLSFAIFLISLTVFPLEDSDIWFHLKAGQWMWENKRLPCPDPFSWPVKSLCWINHSWGLEVAMYGIERIAGLDGIVIAKVALIATTFLLLLLFQIRLTGFSLWGFIILTVGVIASADRFMERVEHLAYFLLVLFLGTLFWWYSRLRFLNPKGLVRLLYLPIILIGLIFLIWGNVHPSPALGMVLLGLFLVGEATPVILHFFKERLFPQKKKFSMSLRYVHTFFSFLVNLFEHPLKSRRAWILLGLGFLATGLAFINPYTYKPVLGVFNLLQEGKSVYASQLIEWESPFSRRHQEMIYTQAFLLTLFLYWLTLIIGWFRNGIRLGPALMLMGVSYLGWVQVRQINVFVVAGYLPVMMSFSKVKPFQIQSSRLRRGFGGQAKFKIQNYKSKFEIKRNFSSLLSGVKNIPKLKAKGKPNFKLLTPTFHFSLLSFHFLLVSGIIFYLGTALYIIKNGYQLGRVYRTFDLGRRPVFADQSLAFLDEHNVNGNLFNDYGMGGYLIYDGYPERKVFMDGRAHYPPEFFLEHGSVNQSAEKAKEVLDKYKIDYVMILHPEEGETTLADYLSADTTNWALIYWDQYYLVYVRRKPPECLNANEIELGSESDVSTLLGASAGERINCQNWHEVIARYEYTYADPVKLRRPEVLEELARSGKDALKLKVRTRGELERNLEIKPDNNRARVLLGGVLELIPDLDEAQEVYEELLKKDPKFALGHFLLGNLLLQQSRRPNSSLSLFGQGEPTPTPDPLNTLTLLTGKTVKKDLWERSKQELRKAFELDETVSRPLVILGEMYQDEGELDEAEKLWAKATFISPTDPEAFYELGILYSNEKFDSEKARYHLERYLLLTSGETKERQRAEGILERLGRD